MILLNRLGGKYRVVLAGVERIGGVVTAFSAFSRVGTDDCCPPVSGTGPV